MRFGLGATFVILLGGACAPQVGTTASNTPSLVPTIRVATETSRSSVGRGQFHLVSFVDESLGWAASGTPDEKSLVVQTKDGGRTWSALPAPPAYVTGGDELRFV